MAASICSTRLEHGLQGSDRRTQGLSHFREVGGGFLLEFAHVAQVGRPPCYRRCWSAVAAPARTDDPARAVCRPASPCRQCGPADPRAKSFQGRILPRSLRHPASEHGLFVRFVQAFQEMRPAPAAQQELLGAGFVRLDHELFGVLDPDRHAAQIELVAGQRVEIAGQVFQSAQRVVSL